MECIAAIYIIKWFTELQSVGDSPQEKARPMSLSIPPGKSTARLQSQ
jgi:hypothetical protein